MKSIKLIKSYPLTIIWTIIVLSLSFKPNPEMPELNLWQPDKIIHFTFYFFYSIFLTFEFRKHLLKMQYPKFSNRFIITTALMLPIAIGVFVELVQGSFIPGRMFDVFDIIANTTGAVIGTFISSYKLRLFK